MTREEIFEFIQRNPVFYLATSTNDQPRVRAMRVYRADERGIIFNTSTSKQLHKQLLANPAIEMCFYDDVDDIQIRLRGTAELIKDTKVRTDIIAEIPALKPWIEGAENNSLSVWTLRKGSLKVWQLDREYVPRVMASYKMTSVWMALHLGDQ